MYRLEKFVLIVTPLAFVACGSIWGFEDAKDRAEADAGGPVAVGDVVPSDVPGIVCAPKAPQDWQGPLAIAVVRGSPLPALPECIERSQKVLDGNGEPIAPPGECTCACDPSTLGACGLPSVTFYSEQTCTTPCAPTQVVPQRKNNSPECTAYNQGTCSGIHWGKVTAAKPAGTCVVSTSGAPVPHSWANAVRLCGPKSDVVAKCDADKALTPASALPYEPGNYCIASITQSECPPTYPRKRQFHDPAQVTDTRACAPCTCGEATGNCGGVVRSADSADDCSGGEKTHPAPSACSDFKDSNDSFGYEPGADGGVNPTCPPLGGGATGTFSAAPITVCCRS